MKNPNLRPSRQRGATLIEAVLSLAVIAVMAVGFGAAVSTSQSNLKLTGAASQLATLRAAGDRYIQDNFNSLITSAASGPVAVSIATLAAGSYLPPSFPTMNAYGQTYQLYIHEKSSSVLESLALTTGGTALSAGDGGRVALLLKASGGYTPAGSSTINGTNGGWSAPLSTYVPTGLPSPSGNPAAYSIQYAVYGPSGALIRYATGNPADNTMQTALNMGANNITNAGNIGAQTINLPSSGTVGMGSSYLYGDNANTALRQNAGFYVQDLAGNTKFEVDNSGNSWQPGNHTAGSGNFNTLSSTAAYTSSLQVYGNTNANQIYANGLSLPGGNALSIGGSYYYGDGYSNASRQNGGFYIQSPDGSSTRWYTDPYGNTWQPGNSQANTVQINGVASAGWGCGPNGLQAQDGSGALLSCKNGVWAYPGGGAGNLHNAGGNNFYCDPGYYLVGFNYNCGCSNNANWFECQPT